MAPVVTTLSQCSRINRRLGDNSWNVVANARPRTLARNQDNRSVVLTHRGGAMRLDFLRSIIAGGLLVAMSGTGALSNESNCRRLEDLARQYVGVQLSSQQQQIKRRLVAWYNDNCKRGRSVHARR